MHMVLNSYFFLYFGATLRETLAHLPLLAATIIIIIIIIIRIILFEEKHV